MTDDLTPVFRSWKLPALFWSLAALLGIGASAAALSASTPQNFVLQPGQAGDRLGDSAYTWPGVQGVVLRGHWNQMQFALDGPIDLSHWSKEIARARQTNRKIAIDLFTGPSTPDFVKCQRFKFTDDRKGTFTMPVPYDPNYQAALAAFVRKLTLALGPIAIEYIHVTGPTRFSNEMHMPAELKKQPGYSLAALRTAWVQDCKLFADCFPKSLIAVNASVLFGNDQADAKQIVDACGAVLGKRMVVMHCALHGQTTNANKTHELVCSYADKYRIGFEMIQPSNVKPQFQGTFEQAVAIAAKAGASYLQPYQGDVGKLK